MCHQLACLAVILAQSNRFLDHRIGEYDADMTPEDRMVQRFMRERKVMLMCGRHCRDTHVGTSACTHTHTCTHTRAHTHMRAHRHACARTHRHARVRAHTHTHTQTYTCVCTHTHTHSHAHTHTHSHCTHTHTHTHTHTLTHTHTHTHTHTLTHTHTHAHTHNVYLQLLCTLLAYLPAFTTACVRGACLTPSSSLTAAQSGEGLAVQP